MDLHEYINPDDPYTPRPKASQAVAAARRAAQPGRPTHETEPIEPQPLNARKYVPFGVGALVLIMLMVGAASYQLARLGDARPLAITPVATDAPTTAPAAAVSAPAPTTAPTATPATIGAYAAPDGLLLGPIELDREIVPVAHFGSAWIQADVHGSGRVWLRASDAPDVALTGPDLARAAQPPAQTGQGLTLSQGAPDATTAVETTAASYLAHVGAQAPHSPRGGLCGPTGGDCAPGVPGSIDNNQYIANVGVQAPHKIR